MNTTLFIRSYPKDYEWLSYSIKSMEKYVTGLFERLLVIPRGSDVTPEMDNFFDRIIYSNVDENIPGYIAQQIDKMEAYKYVNTEYILYSDSDCIYTGPFNPGMLFQETMVEGQLVTKPILNMTPYSELGTTVPWQRVVDEALGFVPVYEFMRCFPIIHRTETVRQLAEAYPDLYEHGRYINNRAYSEFNFIGAFAYKHRHPYYYTEECKSLPCKQFWSYSGLKPEEHEQIKTYLKD